MLLLNSHDNMAQPGRLITVGQLFTVSPEPRPPHLLLVDDLFSGPLSSLNLKLLHWSTHPDSKQGLATPPVELLLSSLTTWLVQRGLLPT